MELTKVLESALFSAAEEPLAPGGFVDADVATPVPADADTEVALLGMDEGSGGFDVEPLAYFREHCLTKSA